MDHVDELSEIDSLDRMADEVVAALRRGEQPSPAELAERYPEFAGTLDGYIRSLTLLEASSSRHHGPMLTARQDDPFSRQLGDFRLLRELGRGGMGIVYEAEQVSLHRRVAIKILPRSPLFGERTLARFVREATAAARLHHSHIVPVFGLGEQEGVRYFVMQCIHGSGLDVVIPEAARLLGGLECPLARDRLIHDPAAHDEVIAAAARLVCSARDDRLITPPAETSGAGKALPTINGQRPSEQHPSKAGFPGSAPSYWKNVARIGVQAAQALAYAHDNDVLHRDLKPANMLLDQQGKLWLTDFGLAKLGEDESLTESGDWVGTIRYLPPEYFRGEYDCRSDLYQLGLTLYEMITFRPAVQAANRQQALGAVLHSRPERPRKLHPEIPRDLETIVMKCLAEEPGVRYASAGLLADDLCRFLQDRPIHARRVGVLERTWRWCRRNRAVAALAGLTTAMLLVIAVVSSVAYLRESRLRREADRTTQTAIQALDHVYAAFVPGWSTVGEAAESGPLMASPEVAQLLEELVQFYDRLATEHGREAQPQAFPDAVKALRRV
ncbi:MAG: serine/threonine protein kinase, partial [Planctomycetaceae bacterium]